MHRGRAAYFLAGLPARFVQVAITSTVAGGLAGAPCGWHRKTNDRTHGLDMKCQRKADDQKSGGHLRRHVEPNII